MSGWRVVGRGVLSKLLETNIKIAALLNVNILVINNNKFFLTHQIFNNIIGKFTKKKFKCRRILKK